MEQLDILDLKLKLLSGVAIEVDKGAGRIEPLTMRELIDFGYSDYLMRLHFLTLEMNDLVQDGFDNELGFNTFDIMVHYGNNDTGSDLENSLSLFFKESRVFIDKDNHIIEIGEGENMRIIDRDNFDKVREVIKLQNCIKKLGEEDRNSGKKESEAVRKIKEKLNKGKEIVDKVKKSNDEGGEDLDLADILSSVSSKSSSLNKINVFDLTLYQLYDEFKRLELIEQYNIAIKSMLAGAKDVKLKHWSTKLDW